MDNESYIRSLMAFNSIKEPVARAMVRALGLKKGSSGLDAGCGVGLQCLLMSEEIGSSGHVTGLDVSPEMLDYGGKIVEKADLSERISFTEGGVAALPFDDNTFDWIWSCDCVGYAPWKPLWEPLVLLRELERVAKPGGTIAIAAWSSEALLPGHPQLEARLAATSAGLAPFVPGINPELHFLRALGWLRKLGLRERKAEVFAGSVRAPMSSDVRVALEDLFGMRWPNVTDELTAEDAAEFRRLCLPDSPDFILDIYDYYAFFTYTMFWGKKPDG
jgi:ubiquinone/menaquinone biosynthesis C-methylase UbiE